MADCKENNEESSNGPKPPIIMKFDAPEESSENSTNEETEGQLTDNDEDKSNPLPKQQNSNSTNRATARSTEGTPFNYFSSLSKPKTSLLRPSQLNVTNPTPGTSAKSVLKPARFQNPFASAVDNSDEVPSSTETSKSEETKEESGQSKVTEEVAPKFLPLGASSAKENDNSVNSSVTPSASTQSFVFGQNLKERVAVAYDADSSDNSEKEETKVEELNENGSSEMLFSNAATVCKSTSRPGLTLTEAAQELEEATRANKRKYDQVALLTGEEGETNVIQINCKLFAFDKATSSWQERGRGSLRLNDIDKESRLVGRTAGTQKLVLNTKVWPGMTAEKAGPKSLRLTAMDANGDVRIFVIQAAPKEIEQLYNLLTQRLMRAQDRQPKKLASDH